ncbi:MAG: hypothetical protein ABR579_03760, partial [Actinomycetota bacterium]
MKQRGSAVVVVAGILTVLLVPMGHAAVRSGPAVGCAWPLLLDEDALNAAFPDTSATYWMAHLPYAAGGRLVVRGRYPNARYFSFHAYDEAQRPVDSIADYQIQPDPGGSNPFASRSHRSGSYTAYVDFSAPPHTRARNTIYAGEMQGGAPNPAGFLIYRIYIPTDPKEPTGGVPLPRLMLRTPDGDQRITFSQC